MKRASVLRSLALACALGAFGSASSAALASFVKPDGSPPVAMPSTLGLEGAYPPASVQQAAAAKPRRESCSASAIRFPGFGIRLVTARHCGGENIEVFDEQSEVFPVGRHDAAGPVDLSLLDASVPLPWQGLPMRSAASLQTGERLCAFRIERSNGDVSRERICARLLRLIERPKAPPLLLLSHPYPPGTSGSALIDREGRAVGVVVATAEETGMAEPIDGILALLSSSPR